MECKEGEPAPQQRSECGGAIFAVMVEFLLSITRVAVQVKSEPEFYHGLQVRLPALARSRSRSLQIYLGSWSKSKKCDNAH
jgi:hypothetical protein